MMKRLWSDHRNACLLTLALLVISVVVSPWVLLAAAVLVGQVFMMSKSKEHHLKNKIDEDKEIGTEELKPIDELENDFHMKPINPIDDEDVKKDISSNGESSNPDNKKLTEIKNDILQELDNLSMPTGDSTPVSIPEISSELELEKNHAQFFGYRVEEIQSNLITLTPASSNRMTWWWLIKRGHGVLARRGYCPYNGQISRQDCLEFCNKINVTSELITAKLEKDEDGKENIFIESFLEGQYSRSTFSIFLERINQEFYEALTQEDIDEIASRLIDTEDDDED